MTLALPASLFAGGQSTPPIVAGYVFDVEGVWLVDGVDHPALSRGSAVRAGDTIQAARGTDAKRLTLVDLDGSLIVQRTCGALPCLPVTVPEPTASPTLTQRLVAIVAQFWRQEPEKYRTRLPRGPGLRNAMVQHGATLDVQPLVQALFPGTYFLQIRRVGEANDTPHLEQVRWAGSGIVTIGPLPNGLYEVLARDARNEPLGVDAGAWLLVVAEARFERCLAVHHQALDAARTWSDETRARVTSPFERALFKHFAESGCE